MRDPYQILGLTRSASADDIKKAYRKLAKEFHPDLKPGNAANEERFKEISAAYTLLSDSDKRARFDRGEIDASGQERHHGFGGRSRANAGRSRAYSGAGGGAGDDSFFGGEDWFSDLFGGGRKRGGPGGGAAGGAAGGGSRSRGSDINYSVSVPFVEAAQGTKRRISLSNGKSIDVAVPPGTEDQAKLRLKGQGLPGAGGFGAGDAIVEVHVEAHPFFTRQGSDIHVEVPITLNEAVLGATIRVPTVSGPVALKIQPGANTGSTLRLRGKGVMNQATKQAGDQYVKLKVVLPDPPDAELVKFMEEWSRTRSYDVRKKAGLE
ncbi:molecular chaperone DnaJ [Azospirillum argentinense]|uniref:J domain-containing protein n=1 Tax=Azospirillum argentinense TaxID=2970906 RepID=A0A5B0L4F4_9PROT|nr:DnaJ C-terminal domain-containing protein [Azospirillum argentinense]AIB11369.1 molecular chaperone DnaJ [Azospirillum argentinense]EZQ08297.1 molecular chaperone DnaJ [Azospirillum argentinense]KAA1058680.1 DnaJ-class molecular chaperone CbpA [Azospirillum argentinense]MBK3799839.1 DnaJ domain-containing protein [Azospirillum argentinense]PNR00581.1 J domain-containing protein [Azospirillum argentinense]